MTQFNLLPNIKLQYLKAQKTRRLVFSFSGLITVASVILAISMFSITALQKAKINSLSSDIKHQGNVLSGQHNLNDILTIQNQIQSLSQLHQQEPEAGNIETYLNQIIPSTASLSSLSVDFTSNSISITGQADSFFTINQLVDSLEFATYSINGQAGSKTAFSNVTLSNYSIGKQGSGFSINFDFDPALFVNNQQVTLTVPSKVTTRSELDQPTQLFQQPINNGTNKP